MTRARERHLERVLRQRVGPAASSASAAAPKASSVAGRPRSASSARSARHGTWATAPSAIRQSSHDAVAARRARRRRTRGRTRTTRARAPCGTPSAAAIAQRRQLDRGDELPRTQLGVALRLVTGQAVQPRHGDRAGRRRGPRRGRVASSAASATAMSDGCVATQASECPRIAWLRWWPAPGRTSRPRLALVARLRHVGEVRAARALQQVAADRRHVPQLAGCAGEHGLREHRVRVAHEQAGGQVGVAHRGADPQSAAVELLDPVVREARDVDEHVGRLDAELHEVDEVRPAAEVARRRARVVEEGDRARCVRRPLVGEGPHRAASWMAGTMFA